MHFRIGQRQVYELRVFSAVSLLLYRPLLIWYSLGIYQRVIGKVFVHV
jgi:hypothetical protein